MGDVIRFESRKTREEDKAEFCLSITITSDGKVTLDLDQNAISTKAHAAWSLSQVSLAIADIVEYKKTLPDGDEEAMR